MFEMEIMSRVRAHRHNLIYEWPTKRVVCCAHAFLEKVARMAIDSLHGFSIARGFLPSISITAERVYGISAREIYGIAANFDPRPWSLFQYVSSTANTI